MEVAGQNHRPRCVIVSDHGLFADLLAMILAAAPDLPLDIVEIASSSDGGIRACDAHRPDVVLLDLGLEDGRGADVADHAAAMISDARVVVVSRQSEARSFNALLGLLANLFQSPVSPGTTRAATSGRRLARMLSRREREVLALIGQRLSSRVIAERLKVSLHTINAHRKNIAHKLGVQGVNLALVAHDYREQLARHR
jgi:DNA-binding NarL/FixJ family response regulator